MEVRNIPALWSALAQWLSYSMFVFLLPKRFENKALSILLDLAFLPLQVFCMYSIVNLDGLRFNLGMVINAAITILPFFVIDRCSVYKRLYYCSRAFIIGGFVSSFGWQVYTEIIIMKDMGENMILEGIVLVLCYVLILLLIYLMEKRHIHEITEMDITLMSSLSTMAIAYIVYIISSLSYSDLKISMGFDGYRGAFMFRTVFYLSGIFMLYAHHLQLCESFVALENQSLSNMLSMQYQNYQMNQESVDLINQKYHDLKQQILLLRSELSKETKTELLDKMEYDIKMYEAQNKTGNKYLDTILTGKKIRCLKENILLTCVADGSLLDFMDIMDLSAVFGNALDNAIEEVCRIKDTEQRLIHFSVSKEKSFVRVHIENRCSESLYIENKIPLTSKGDRRYHGYGLKSIKKVVEKYQGSFTIHAENGWFEIRMLFPLSE